MAFSLAEYLAKRPEFADLDQDEIAAISALVETRHVTPARPIWEESEGPPGPCLILAGGVELVVVPGTQSAMVLDSLHEGAVFAVEALWSAAPLPYRAQAGADSVVIQVLPRVAFVQHIGTHPSVSERIARARQAVSFAAALTSAAALASAEGLREVPRDALLPLARQAREKRVPAGARLVEQGKVEDFLFVVVSGCMAVTRRDAPGARVGTIGAGDLVGEMAVMRREARSADVTAETDCVVLQLPGEIFREAVATHRKLSSAMAELMRARSDELARSADLSSLQDQKQPKFATPIPPWREYAPRPEWWHGWIDRAVSWGTALPRLRAQAVPAWAATRIERARAATRPTLTWPAIQSALTWRTVRDAPVWITGLIARTWAVARDLMGRKPPAIRQHSEMDCGAACLATICAAHGKRVSINFVREAVRVRQEGASMENIMRAAREFGFEVQAYLSTIEQLREKPLPAIANWRGYHWVVVHRVTDTHVMVADPAQGLVDYTLAEFQAGWSRYAIFLRPTERFAELAESPPALRSFVPFVLPFRRTVFEIFAAAVFLQALAIMLPLFTKFVVDDVLLRGDEQWLTLAITVMAGVTFLNMALSYLRNEMLLRMSMRANLNVVSTIYERLLRLPIGFFEARRTGDITSRLNQHETITKFLTEDGLETFLSILTAIAYFAFMLYFNAWLALAAVSFLFLNVGVIRVLSPRIRQIGRESFVKEAEQESHIIESLRGAATLKMLGADALARWQYENHFAGIANIQFKSAKLSQMASILAGTLDSLSDVAVLFLGGAFVIWGDMTIGELIAFTAFANGVQRPVNSIIGKWDELQEVLVAVERLNDVLEKEPEFQKSRDADLISLPQLKGDIEFRNVTFRYEPDDPVNVVQNIDLKIAAGQRVALVGASGSGKSTLVKLLYGLYRPSSGDIFVDGFSLRDAFLPSLRRQIGMVPQENLIFRGTVRENIALANRRAGIGDIREAAELAAAHDFIASMPGGYDGAIEEQGTNISGGQRQRLVLARAFLQPSSILIMDEGTAALDVETERRVMESVKSRFGGKTVLIIAHRLSTIRNADVIVVLNEGMVVETGAHEELMARRGHYYQLCAQHLSPD